MTRRGVLFDVDGTLVDTTYLHAVTWHEALRQHGHEITTARIHPQIGMGSDELIEHLLGSDRDKDQDSALADTHLTLYRQHWGRLVRLPGAREVLRACKSRGLVVVLASSASEPELDALRGTLDCDDAVDVATSSTDAGEGKPAPDLIQAAMTKAGLDPTDAVYVGDSVWDGAATRRAGIPFVGLLCGGSREAELRAAGAIEVWRDAQELADHLDDSIVGRRLPVPAGG
jgi:HAD superfamily hydrolase (TIGR01509 family)